MPKSKHVYKTINPGHLTKNEAGLWRALYHNDLYANAQVPVAKKLVYAGRYTREIVGAATDAEIADPQSAEGQAIFSFEFDSDIMSAYSDYRIELTIPYAVNTDTYTLPSYLDRVVINVLFVFDGTDVDGSAAAMYHQFISQPRSTGGYFGPLHFSSVRSLFDWGFDVTATSHSCSVYIVAPKDVKIGASDTAPIYFTLEENVDGN